MNEEWSKQMSLQLIRIFRANPVLWSARDPDYYNREAKRVAWAAIGATMGFPVYDCKRKMTSLTGSFRREKWRMRTNPSTARGCQNVLTSQLENGLS